jgi:hypothetical protein
MSPVAAEHWASFRIILGADAGERQEEVTGLVPEYSERGIAG